MSLVITSLVIVFDEAIYRKHHYLSNYIYHLKNKYSLKVKTDDRHKKDI